jgi:gamma-glutamyltranspeptidase/glutathione hydrolase
MKMIEPFNLAEMGHNSLKAIQVITEAEGHLLIEMRS